MRIFMRLEVRLDIGFLMGSILGNDFFRGLEESFKV